jgi:predicted alpha/beta hydrolase
VQAADGYPLAGFLWRHEEQSNRKPVVIVNPATSVRCRYYSRFAEYLHAHGFDVLTYDYRGIGESRPQKMRGFDAGWSDWGRLDCNAMLRYADRNFPGQPIYVVGHSLGGYLLGITESNRLVRRVFTVGAQYACWRDYAAGARLRMLAKWHLAMPLVTLLYGYFPGKGLGWMEDTPRGVVWDWAVRRKRVTGASFAGVTAPILAVSVTDDEFGTVAAIERLLAHFTNAEHRHLRIAPGDIGENAIGHFGFFHSRFQQKLWPIALEWMNHGTTTATQHRAAGAYAGGAEFPPARSAGRVDAPQ